MSLPCGTFQENYAQDMAILRTKSHWVMLIAFLAFLFACPLFFNDRILAILTMIGIAVIAVHGLNILTGYCGQISIGHVGFMAVGAYTSAVLCARLGWSFWAALPCAALAAGMVGLIFGLPSLRVKAFYLIMATIAAHFIIVWVIIQFRNVTGGADGMAVPRPELFGFVFKSKAAYFYLVMIIACLATFLARNIVRTKAGRAFIAIRDNDLAAEVMGINPWSYKLLAFFIGCVGYDLRFGRPTFVSHQKWHGWNCQVDIIPHGCCPVAETKINAAVFLPVRLAHCWFTTLLSPVQPSFPSWIQCGFWACSLSAVWAAPPGLSLVPYP